MNTKAVVSVVVYVHENVSDVIYVVECSAVTHSIRLH